MLIPSLDKLLRWISPSPPFKNWFHKYLSLLYRLFHILVDSDKTAAQILSIMNKHKLPGEVTFMPLNRLLSKEQQYPSTPVSNPEVHFERNDKINHND